MLLSTVFTESGDSSTRAEIYETPDGYVVEYYGPTGFIKSETYHDKSIQYVENIAATWAKSVKVLNG